MPELSLIAALLLLAMAALVRQASLFRIWSGNIRSAREDYEKRLTPAQPLRYRDLPREAEAAGNSPQRGARPLRTAAE